MRTTRARMGMAAIVLVAGAVLSGCADGVDATDPVELDGEWRQTNGTDPDRWQAATIAGDEMTINWVTDGGDTRALYWAGSFEPPTDSGAPYSWESINDETQTANALLASTSETKTFSYADGEISYEVSVMGVTTTVKLSRD